MNPTWLYVGALYALAVWLARRGVGAPALGRAALPRAAALTLPRRVALLFYALVVVFLFRPMTGDYVNVATDVPQLIPPWSASAPGLTKYQISNFETQDVPMQLVPWMHQVREAWRAGRLPLWNELTGCGYPLLGNGQAQALSPIRLLALPLPLKYAITAEGAMKILIALTFTFLYCRRRYGLAPSIIAAICFSFGPFVIVWLNFAIATTAVFLPAVLYAIDLLAEQRTPPRFALMAVIGALVVFGGHPETALHMAVFAAAYVLVMVPRKLPRFAAAAIVAVLLALPMLVAMGEAIPQSYRYEQVRQWSREVPFSDVRSLSLLVQPRLFGRHDPAGAESITGFAGILGIAAWLAVALSVHLSALRRSRGGRKAVPLRADSLELRALESSSHMLFFVFASLFVFLVLANWHPATAIADVVFGLAANMRLRFLLAFMLAVLTGALVDHVRGLALGAGLAFAAATLLYVFHRFPGDRPREVALIGAIPSVIALAVAVLLLLPPARKLAPWVVLAAVIAELWPVTITWNPTRPARTLYPRTPLIDAVTNARKGWGQTPLRVVGIGSVLFPNTNVMFGIEDVRFHDPMVPARYVHAMGLNTSDYYVKWNRVDDALSTRWVLTEPGQDAPFILRYDGPDGRLYENPRAKPRFYSNDAAVRIAKASPTDYMLAIDAARPATILSSIGWARGWTPSKPGVFVSFDVPAGRSVVRVHYAPLDIYAGFAVALLTMIALAAYIIRARV